MALSTIDVRMTDSQMDIFSLDLSPSDPYASLPPQHLYSNEHFKLNIPQNDLQLFRPKLAPLLSFPSQEMATLVF